MGKVFDYVIVGAGSAGCVLANRLSADPSRSVCLIEAGPSDTHPLIDMPLGVIWLAKNARHNWLYSSTPQPSLNGRRVSIPRGKVLGGSSSINGMIYIQGHRADYDAWANAGCKGWSYDDVSPFFERAQQDLSVTDLRDPNPIDTDFMDAAMQLQIRRCADFNSAEPEGVGIYKVTQANGKRHSTSRAFLSSIGHRKNLTVLTGAEVRHLAISNRVASGVVVNRNGESETINSRMDVILSAGAFGSPDVLLRSGIGPAQQIKSFGGNVLLDLPGVGQNLQDHVDMMVISASTSTIPYGFSVSALPRLAGETLRWAFSQRGMFSSNMVEAGGFVRSQPSEPRPDLQFHIIPGRKSHRGRMIEYGHGVSLHCCVLRPDSRGQITRTSKEGPPEIDLGLLNDERDMDRLLRGVKLSRQILMQQPMAKHGLSEIVPGKAAQTDDELRAAIRAHARTVYHPIGTCAMGTGPRAVVDPSLRVKGISNLRVVDASVMPTIISGNTNAPTIMIAEKAADMILNETRIEKAA
jgi:choline dehydrogenase